MNDDGTVTKEGDQFVLGFERLLRHPREKVWRAITESAHLAHWLPCDIVGERAQGASIELPFWPDHIERYKISMPLLTGSIAVWEPPSVFEWWWSTDRLRFELEEVDEGTVLRFRTWLSDEGHSTSGTAAGYHVCFDRLRSHLDGDEPESLDDADARTGSLEVRYTEAVAALA